MADCAARVHDFTPENRCNERLSVVSELRLAREAITDGHANFVQDAVAPSGPWRAPTSYELIGLLGHPGCYAENDVFVVSLHDLAHSLSTHFESRTDLSLARNASCKATFFHAIEGCGKHLEPFCIQGGDVESQGAAVNAGGMSLITQDMDVTPPQRIGLHVDDWDHLAVSERSHSRRRLCVNLGLMSRYLVFLPKPLSALAAEGKFPSEISHDESPARVVRRYLSRNLRQLAVRVRIDPGEAYIFNAEDVIHDGSSDLSDVPDIALHFLGPFEPPAGIRHNSTSGFFRRLLKRYSG